MMELKILMVGQFNGTLTQSLHVKHVQNVYPGNVHTLQLHVLILAFLQTLILRKIKKILSYTYLLVPLAVSPTLLEYSDLILQILIFWILETAESPTKYSLANFHTEAARSAFWTYQFGIWPIELQIQSTFFTSI